MNEVTVQCSNCSWYNKEQGTCMNETNQDTKLPWCAGSTDFKDYSFKQNGSVVVGKYYKCDLFLSV